MGVPKRVGDRIKSTLRGYQKILEAQRARDISEADTVTVVKDVLADVFGYDKYAEITGEHSIRGTYCDLALHVDSKLHFLVEVKSIGIDLKDSHVKQAVDYAANQGCDWVVLTNGIKWVLYHISFQKPISKQEVVSVDLLNTNHRSESDLERLYLFTREGISKSALAEYRDRREATNRHVLAAILLNCDNVIATIRKEVRRMSGLLVDEEELRKTLREQVIKREAIEGEEAQHASRKVARSADKPIASRRGRQERKSESQPAETPPPSPVASS